MPTDYPVVALDGERANQIVLFGRRQRVRAAQLSAAALLLVCAVASPVASIADAATAGVRIIMPALPAIGPEGYSTFPLVADIVPEAYGTLWYRFGAGPGPWKPVTGPVA
ncbi:MAG TPA: hypothetical protein VIK32_00635, partial [Candidatus Limnocylindrales bacterium]